VERSGYIEKGSMRKKDKKKNKEKNERHEQKII
jgi:hypothetical protein